jgi:membrane associated rhomboid family serine protease
MVNYLLIGANVMIFMILNDMFLGKQLAAFRDQTMTFQSTRPQLHQFFTYQFVHADAWHLIGNMLFLWVFGNSVNAKMGDWAYLLFYLAGGVFAAWGFAAVNPDPFQLVGASGSIAAVTTGYLVLFPRSRVLVLIWFFFFIHFIDVSAMLIIGLKIIVYDNIVAPSLGGSGQVAHQAHLAGYVFGFVVSVIMLLIRALPRDQFDMLALWKRWNQRREFASAMAAPGAAERAQFGSVGHVQLTPAEQAKEDERFNRIADMRSRISQSADANDMAEAVRLYENLIIAEPNQCMPENHQLQIARHLYGEEKFSEAAKAFERFAEAYPRSVEVGNVVFLLGIIYARDLREYDNADRFLTRTWETVRDDKRKQQCLQWLKDVRAALGRPAPEA